MRLALPPVDQFGSWWHSSAQRAAVPGRGLMPRRTVRIPGPALTGWRKMTRRNVRLSRVLRRVIWIGNQHSAARHWQKPKHGDDHRKAFPVLSHQSDIIFPGATLLVAHSTAAPRCVRKITGRFRRDRSTKNAVEPQEQVVSILQRRSIHLSKVSALLVPDRRMMACLSHLYCL